MESKQKLVVVISRGHDDERSSVAWSIVITSYSIHYTKLYDIGISIVPGLYSLFQTIREKMHAVRDRIVGEHS